MVTLNGHGMGWLPDSPERIDKIPLYLPSMGLHAIPTEVDIRKWDSPIDDQGNLGSCTAFMIDAVIKFVRNVLGLPPLQLSQLFTYWCERVLEGTTSYDSGASIGDAFDVAANPGCCKDALWPYDVSKFTQKPPPACWTDAALDVATQELALDGSLDSIKACLAEGYPVGFGFDVYSSFRNIGPDGIMPVPNLNTEDVLGGHAVMFVGYKDSVSRFIVRNSWGVGWGNKGYFEMPYQIVTDGMAADFRTVRMVSGGVTPTPTPPPAPAPTPVPSALETRVKALEDWRDKFLVDAKTTLTWTV